MKKVLLVYNKWNSWNDYYFRRLKESLDKYTDIKTQIFEIPRIFEKVPFLIWIYFLYIKNKINFDYDILHINAEFWHYFKEKNKKLVITLHHNNFDVNYQKYTSFLQKIYHHFWIKPNLKKTFRKADTIIAVSEFTKQSYNSYFNIKKPIKVIYNWVEIDKYNFISNEKIVNNKIRFLFIWNQWIRKWWDMIIEIMKKLWDGYELYHTWFRSSDSNSLEKYNIFALWRLSDEQVILEYNKADMFLFPSRLEWFWYSIVEAMLCWIPVITTDYSSMKEIVKPWINWFLCEMNNIDDFIDKIHIALNTKFDKHKIRESVLCFNMENLAKNYEKLYNEI